MVLQTRAVDKQQAAALGMLTSQAGLAALQAVLALQPVAKTGIGAAPQSFWQALLAHVKELPPMLCNFSMPDTPAIMDKHRHSVSKPKATQETSKAFHEAASMTSIEGAVTRAAAGILGTEELDTKQPLAAQGLDSLASLELRQRIQVGHGDHKHLPVLSFWTLSVFL